jgi:pantoate--beta-alanine ligase
VIVLERIADVRAACDGARTSGGRVGLVPTMGAFHEGHRALMRAARGENDLVVTSLFVNPTQFSPWEDLDAYPRDREGDAAVAASEGVDVFFVPTVTEMYPAGARTTVSVRELTNTLCGAARPGHFDGVTTIVAKLFAIAGPCRAYFGRKDAQQLAVVRRMTADLDLPVEVVGCPLVREPDGLALSSRNLYLAPEERAAAVVLVRALRAAAHAVRAGRRDAHELRELIAGTIVAEPRVRLDYAEIVDAATLQPIDDVAGEVLVAVAVFVGAARLIDNVSLTVAGDDGTVDLGVVTTGTSEER